MEDEALEKIQGEELFKKFKRLVEEGVPEAIRND